MHYVCHFPPAGNNRKRAASRTSHTRTALDPPVPHLAPHHPLPRIRSLVISRPCTARVVIGPPHQWQKRGYLRPSFQITLIISVACAVPGGGCAPLVPLVQPEEPLRLLASLSGPPGASNAKCITLHLPLLFLWRHAAGCGQWSPAQQVVAYLRRPNSTHPEPFRRWTPGDVDLHTHYVSSTCACGDPRVAGCDCERRFGSGGDAPRLVSEMAEGAAG